MLPPQRRGFGHAGFAVDNNRSNILFVLIHKVPDGISLLRSHQRDRS